MQSIAIESQGYKWQQAVVESQSTSIYFIDRDQANSIAQKSLPRRPGILFTPQRIGRSLSKLIVEVTVSSRMPLGMTGILGESVDSRNNLL
jgi:hypothetical protein